MKYKRYDKSFEYSYTFGLFPTIELVKSKKSKLIALILSEKLNKTQEIENIIQIAKTENAEIIESSKQIDALGAKDNCYLVGVFKKYKEHIENGNHVVLVSPTDSGNLGTIIRTMIGLNINNLAIIENGKDTQNKVELEKSNTSVDIFNPKTIRASMGSIFNINIEYFKNYDEYESKFKQNTKYAFCLEGEKYLQEGTKTSNNYSLIFGNEATGLPDNIINKCEKIKIRQSEKIDSYNLAISVAMAIYEFTKKE